MMPRTSERFLDPEGKKFGIPTFPWQMAPEGLATRRQLTNARLRPGGAPVVAQIMWDRGGDEVGVAYLYELAAAVPKRPYTDGLARSVAAMLVARSTCAACGTVYDYCLPKSRDCWRCQDGGRS